MTVNHLWVQWLPTGVRKTRGTLRLDTYFVGIVILHTWPSVVVVFQICRHRFDVVWIVSTDLFDPDNASAADVHCFTLPLDSQSVM